MRTIESPFRNKVRDAAKTLNIDSQRASFAARVKSTVEDVLTNWGAVTVPVNTGSFGLESLGKVVPERNENFNAARDGDAVALVRSLNDLGMPARHIEQVGEACMMLFDNNTYNAQDIVRFNEESDNYVSMAKVVGRTSAVQMSRAGEGIGLEAFGDDINRLNTDDRLTMSLMIMRPWDNIMDKGLARVNQSSPVVTIRIPQPQAYDWAVTQQANSTSSSRNGPSNTYNLRDLYRNPTPVTAAPKKVVPLTANDSDSVLWGATTQYYKTAKEVSLLDLSRDTSRVTYDHVDRTDLIADGGTVDGIIVSINNSNTSTTESFAFSTRSFDLAMFSMTPSNKKSGQRQVIMDAKFVITSATTQWNGSASTIAAALTDAKLLVTVRMTVTLDIQFGILQGSGTASLSLLQLANGTTISSATNTLFGYLSSTVPAYSVDVYFDEENQRKANLAIWVQYSEQQFMVPRSRIYLSEYALTQDIDENAVAATSSIVSLGNGRRGLGIVVNALYDIAKGMQDVSNNPEVANLNSLDDMSYASALVKPTVLTTTLDLGVEELNTMNESTRLSEIHGRFRARFLSMVTMLFAKSLMLNQYKGGEVPVLKAWVHNSIADTVIGILEYHPDLQDRATTATGADFSMTLPNGYRLDVIKTNLDCLQQRIYAIPVIESDPASVLSAASIRDCGTVTTNYTPTNSGAVVRRTATTTREIVFPSNKVGICMIVQGLTTQLGTSGFTPITLNADYTDSITM